MAASDFPRFDLNGHVALVTGAARGIGGRARWPWRMLAPAWP